MTQLFEQKVTVYNDILATETGSRRFERHVIPMCNVQGGYVQKADGTIQNIVGAKTVIMRDISHYRSPEEYATLTIDERESLYTVRIGDYIVLREVDDDVSSGKQLQQKYGDEVITVSDISVNIFGMKTDNITVTNA